MCEEGSLRCAEVPCTVIGLLLIVLIPYALLPVSPQTSFCTQIQPEDIICVRKCCPPGRIFSAVDQQLCESSPDEVPFPSLFKQLLPDVNFNGTFIQVLEGIPCRAYQKFSISNGTRILNTGELIADDNETWNEHESCFEEVVGREGLQSFVCNYEPVDHEEERMVLIVTAIGDLVSWMSYVATFLVYALVPSLHEHFQGQAVMYHVLCMIIQTTASAIVDEIGYSPGETYFGIFCVIFFYVATMASFSWLTVMCFDIWINFRNLEHPTLKKESADRRNRWYCAVAWGAPPLYFALVALAVNYITAVEEHVELFALHLPVALSLYLNAAMFFATWCRLRSYQRGSRALGGEDSRVHQDRTRYIMFVNLFLIMGAPWVVRAVRLLHDEGIIYSDLYVLNICLALIEGLQGVLIFVIFVCNKRVCQHVRQHCCSSSADDNTSSTSVKTH